jgi:hypothetical protein
LSLQLSSGTAEKAPLVDRVSVKKDDEADKAEEELGKVPSIKPEPSLGPQDVWHE